MAIFTAGQNLANLNEIKINLIIKFANLAGKSYIITKRSDMIYKASNITLYDNVLIFQRKILCQTQEPAE